MAALDDLRELAFAGKDALQDGDLEGLGLVMKDAWWVHQKLDRHCSNPNVEAILHAIEPWVYGAKLAGAGGGGFAAAMAKDKEAAATVCKKLGEIPGVVVYPWSIAMD